VFQLERISLHEWYLFEAEDIEIRGATAVLGATGAGKSALLDAIQTVITGNNRNVLQLNYSAGTARDRTVESYCLGRVSDFNRGEPRRDRSETIIALTFRSNLTGFQVSAGLLLAADVTESGGVETKARFVIRGHAFKMKDFSITNAAGEEFVPKHDDLILRMKEKFGNPELDYGSLQKANLAVDARRALDQIEVIVGSEDDTREIEDYRNYFEFDLQITSEDGQQASFSKVVGTLSGGQRQAPYYVAIAASMVSAYFPSGKLTDSEGLSLVVFDEAFDKLDVRTTKALLDLFRHLGLPTFVENVDTVVSVLRQPSTDALFVRTAQPGPAAKEAMRQANPEHIGVEGYRVKLAEAAQQQTLPPAA
jgi:uncharacterized protein YPO0396